MEIERKKKWKNYQQKNTMNCIKNILRKFADSGKTVIFSTHIMEVAEKICDKVGIINKGKIAYCGNLQDLKEQNEANEDLEKIFLELTDNE